MSSLKFYFNLFSLLSTSISLGAVPAFAAKPIDLSKGPVPFTSSVRTLTANQPGNNALNSIEIMSSDTDANHVTHVRIQQLYAGVPVWGADAVAHVPPSKNRAALLATSGQGLAQKLNADPAVTKNGIFYADLQQDLANIDVKSLNSASAKQAAIAHYKEVRTSSPSGKNHVWSFGDESSQLFVYTDENNKAHWAYLVSFSATAPGLAPKRPTAIVDAQTYDAFIEWDDMKSETAGMAEPASAIGRGGNPLLGDWAYDGAEKSLLPITHMKNDNVCQFKNDDVEVRNALSIKKIKSAVTVSFPCASTLGNRPYSTPQGGYFEKENGAYSPANDALYYGMEIKKFYSDWYQTDVLCKSDKGHGKDNPCIADANRPGRDLTIPLVMTLLSAQQCGEECANAFWDDNTETMNFGLGDADFYPFVTLGIAAHEVSHGFTSKHANLIYNEQSGALNESFSDMAAAATSYYQSGEKETEWKLGTEIFKENVGKNKEEWRAIRYFDDPMQDNQSIDNINQYKALKEKCNQLSNGDPDGAQACLVHTASGVFNKAFYHLATTKGWTTKSAFEVMIKANKHYWTKATGFEAAACAVQKAALDIREGNAENIKQEVGQAFNQVGISLASCA